MLHCWLVSGLGRATPEVARGEVSPTDPIVHDDADLVLLFGGEQRGQVGPCGCDARPLGGLARIRHYADLAAGGVPGTPVYLLNPGAWLSNQSVGPDLLDTTRGTNADLHAALRHAPYDVLNVTFRDWPDVAAGPRPGLVSANHRAEGIPVVRYRLLSADPWTVAVTGVSRTGLAHLQPDPLETTPATTALVDLLPELRHHADLVVVLVYDLPGETEAIAALPGVDLVIEAGDYSARYGPWTVGDAVWVRSWRETTHLGELRLWLDQGQISRGILRDVPMDATLDPPPRHGLPERGASSVRGPRSDRHSRRGSP